MLSLLCRPRIYIVGAVVALAGVVAGYRGYVAAGERILAELTNDARQCAAAFAPGELGQLAGVKSDVGTPLYEGVKGRLRRMRDANRAVRFVYVFRAQAAPGKTIFLADSESPGSDKISLPGDDYAEAAESPGLQAIIRTGEAATEGPIPDQFGVWVTGYARIDDAPGGRHIIGIDVSAASWRRQLWSAGIEWALYVWLLGGLPLAAGAVLRRQFRQQSEIRNLTEAMEQSHSALMIVDLKSRITYANAGLCRQMGFPREAVLGKDWRSFQVADTPAEVLEDLENTVRAGQSWRGDWFNRRADGSTYPVRGIVTPVKDDAGRLACYVAALEDVSESKRIEAELREARDRAEAGDKAKGQFLAMMSHEVRTPLNGIVGFTGLLLDTTLTTEQRDYAHTIRLSGETLIQLTGDILDFCAHRLGQAQAGAGAVRCACLRRRHARSARGPGGRKGPRIAPLGRPGGAAAGDDGPQPVAAGAGESREQRGEVYRHGRDRGAGGGGADAGDVEFHRARHGHRYPARPAGETFPPV
jgi:PAS domain S-box-containing protein